MTPCADRRRIMDKRAGPFMDDPAVLGDSLGFGRNSPNLLRRDVSAKLVAGTRMSRNATLTLDDQRDGRGAGQERRNP